MKIGEEFLNDLLITNTPFIDVRASVEFEHGHLPGAVNLPILNNHERSEVGTVYKRQGREAAVALGHQLISGAVKAERMAAWIEFIRRYPDTAIYCFRGGLRSQITQKWLQEIGIERPILQTGYKGARHHLDLELQKFCRNTKFLTVSGMTGCGKTRFLQNARRLKHQGVIDLEDLANHRGSAFGALPEPQPSQAQFEILLSTECLKITNSPKQTVLIEDESRLVGRCALPQVLFTALRSAEVIWLEEPLEKRVENIFEDYILKAASISMFDQYKKAVLSITPKLGGLRSKEILELIEHCKADYCATGGLTRNLEWIEKILVYYYDPVYHNSLTRRQVTSVFRGSGALALEALRGQ